MHVCMCLSNDRRQSLARVRLRSSKPASPVWRNSASLWLLLVIMIGYTFWILPFCGLGAGPYFKQLAVLWEKCYACEIIIKIAKSFQHQVVRDSLHTEEEPSEFRAAGLDSLHCEDSGTALPGFESWLCHLPPTRVWSSNSVSASVSWGWEYNLPTRVVDAWPFLTGVSWEN